LVVLEAVPASEADSASEPDAGGIVPGRVTRVDTSTGILVETGNGRLALQRLQLQSRKPLDWRSFQNGVQGFVGAVLGGS
ncbi:MAG: methionyl-tRNA formyltransferase, partial [Spirochaetota bacterium]